MAIENCKDLNGNDISRIVLQDDGTVLGVLSTPSSDEDGYGSSYDSATSPVSRTTDPNQLGVPNKECCERFGYTFDNNKCYWSQNVCNPTPDFKIVMNAQGNSGALFDVDEDENCILTVNFDYLFQFDCETLLECKAEKSDAILKEIGDLQTKIKNKEDEISFLEGSIEDCTSGCESLESQLLSARIELGILNTQLSASQIELAQTSYRIIDMLRFLDVCVTLEKVVPNEVSSDDDPLYQSSTTVKTIYEESLFNIGGDLLDSTEIVEYFRNNSNTGFLFEGDNCDVAINTVISELGSNCDAVSDETFDSNWLSHSFTISDEETLDLIKNEKVKLGIKIKNCECDFSVLIDKIEFNKSCDKVDVDNVVVTTCPGFDLLRECDNKKSWVALDSSDNRIHDLGMRDTDYDVNHHKLTINSKEVDLNVDIARGVETDVWCYISDNPCLLSGCTSGSSSASTATTCVDLNDLVTTPLSSATTVKKFKEIICSELIDAKSHKVMNGYPILDVIYDRYKNSELYCSTKSSAFNYDSMIDFAGLVGNYWVDLIEQVIPSTALWGSTYVYSNTIFDKQKFNYKRYSLFTCDEPTSFPFSAIGENLNVDVVKTNVSIPESNFSDCVEPSGNTETCSGVWNMQYNDGSEFIGTVKVVSNPIPPTGSASIGEAITNPDASDNNEDGDTIVIIEDDPLRKK